MISAMDKHREPLWQSHWDEARKAKAERRRQNREDWQKSRVNSNQRRERVLEATVEVSAEPIADDDAMADSASLRRLRKIMLDDQAALHRRIDASEIVLSYELGPGAVAGVAPDEIAAVSYQFLKQVIDDTNVPEALSFRALALVAKVENTRAQIKNAGEMVREKRELLCNLINSARRMALYRAKCWPPPRDVQWFVTLADNIPLPGSWVGMVWPPVITSPSYRRDAERFHEELRSMRASNRDDDWEKLLPAA